MTVLADTGISHETKNGNRWRRHSANWLLVACQVQRFCMDVVGLSPPAPLLRMWEALQVLSVVTQLAFSKPDL